MKTNKLKFLLLAYLTFILIFPSYHGMEEGEEFHFFVALDGYRFVEIQNEGEEIEYNSCDSHHPHSRLFFCPARRLELRKQDRDGGVIKNVTLTDNEEKRQPEAEQWLDRYTFFSLSPTDNIYKRHTSGLPPPSI